MSFSMTNYCLLKISSSRVWLSLATSIPKAHALDVNIPLKIAKHMPKVLLFYGKLQYFTQSFSRVFTNIPSLTDKDNLS